MKRFISNKFYSLVAVNLIYIVTLLAVIATLIIGYFSAGSTLHEINREWRINMNVQIAYAWGLTLFFILTIGLLIGSIKIKFAPVFFYTYILAFSSALLISRHISPMFLIGAFFFMLILQLREYFKLIDKLKYISIWILLFWATLPAFMDILGYSFGSTFYWYDGFRGFAFDRVEYAFFVGFIFLVLITDTVASIKKYWYLLLFLVYCIFISQSRFIYLALIVSLTFFWGLSWRTIFSLIFLFVVFVIGITYGVREDQMESGRSVIYLNYITFLENNVHLIFFGASSFYQSFNNGDVPHNFILQSIINWGFIGLIFWLSFIYRFYITLDRSGRSLLVYLHVYGLFHPGVDAYLISPTIAIVYLFATRRSV